MSWKNLSLTSSRQRTRQRPSTLDFAPFKVTGPLVHLPQEPPPHRATAGEQRAARKKAPRARRRSDGIVAAMGQFASAGCNPEVY